MFPRMPYNMRRAERQITRFLGLNLTENTKEGEFADAYGITTAGYPCITQRDSRHAVEGYINPTDVFEWDGNLCVIDNGILYYNGEPLDNVSNDKKHFAAIGSKIIVLPDRFEIDTQKNLFRRLGGVLQTTGDNSVRFTANTIYAPLTPTIKSNIEGGSFRILISSSDYENDLYTIYTYGNAADCWDAEAETWNFDNTTVTKKIALTSVPFGTHDLLAVGDIIIPSVSGNTFSLVRGEAGGDPNTENYNKEGYYAVITDAVETQYAVIGSSGAKGPYDIRGYFTFDVYNAGTKNALFSGTFAVGDYVDIKGTANGINDCEHVKITAIDDENNAITFEGASAAEMGGARFWIASYTMKETKLAKYCQYKITEPDIGTYYYYNTSEVDYIKEGDIVYIAQNGEEYRIKVFRPRDGVWVKDYKATRSTSKASSSSSYKVYSCAGQGVITISAPFPELDFICTKDNRLWGVSNKDNTVYVSALGKPNDFYSYETADSYAVALGSDGDFTAICAYGDSVLCWKEDILHKFYGDMPSNYQCTDVKIAGVQKGSERSLTVIDEKLYYKGTFGVYVYSGGIPQKISYNLGNKLLTDAVGGGYRDRYYLSAKDASGTPTLLAYDITHGLWMQEDKLYAEAFARVGTALYMLSDGVLYECGAGDEKVPWMAEFVPFDETVHNRKGYAMLRLRLDMGDRSYLRVETRCDRGQWREVFSKSATDAMTVNVPLKIGRCDRFAVRLSGRGECVIRSMEREFLVGSKR